MDRLNHYLDEHDTNSYLSVHNTVLDAVKAMKKNNTSYVIAQENGVDVGIFTESDLRNRVALNNRLPSQVKLAQVITRNIRGVDLNSSIDDSLRKLKENKVHHLPILKKGKVIAVLNVRTLLKIALKSLSSERRQLIEYINGAPYVSI
jgi:signal-transduction protein with cAMP-binding, CBS, and nucleotidyltransferase domain